MTGTIARLVGILANEHPRGDRTEVALLVSLAEACGGVRSIGGGGAASSTVPLNPDAVDLANTIRGDLIRDLIRMQQALKYQTLAGILTQWHNEWSRGYPTAAEEGVWVATLTRWEADIRRVIASHERAPVQSGSCPICGRSRFVRAGDETWALLREWEHDDPHATMKLTCLACAKVLAVGSRAVAATLGIDTAEAVARYVENC